jgi:hypothetical protein
MAVTVASVASLTALLLSFVMTLHSSRSTIELKNECVMPKISLLGWLGCFGWMVVELMGSTKMIAFPEGLVKAST